MTNWIYIETRASGGVEWDTEDHCLWVWLKHSKDNTVDRVFVGDTTGREKSCPLNWTV